MHSAKAREEDVALRILLVDDEPALLRLMARALKAAGIETLSARSGREALGLLRTQSLDAMITDIGMPELDGMTLLRATRQVAPELPVIVITGDTTEATAERAGQLGAVALLLKPLHLGELVELSLRVARRERP
jgi:CheY-like chemotaxis protein